MAEIVLTGASPQRPMTCQEVAEREDVMNCISRSDLSRLPVLREKVPSINVAAHAKRAYRS
jgi:hypothetical protein